MFLNLLSDTDSRGSFINELLLSKSPSSATRLYMSYGRDSRKTFDIFTANHKETDTWLLSQPATSCEHMPNL